MHKLCHYKNHKEIAFFKKNNIDAVAITCFAVFMWKHTFWWKISWLFTVIIWQRELGFNRSNQMTWVHGKFPNLKHSSRVRLAQWRVEYFEWELVTSEFPTRLPYVSWVLEVESITKVLLYLQLLEIFPLCNMSRCFSFFLLKDEDK